MFLRTSTQERAEKLAGWVRAGMPDDDARFFQQHPEMIDNPEGAEAACAEAYEAGHKHKTAEFYHAVKVNFYGGPRPEPQPNPPVMDDDYSPRRAVFSAPVSREVPASNGSGYDQFNMRVTLGPAEKEAAAISGISEAEYAAQKLKLLELKRQGEYGGSR